MVFIVFILDISQNLPKFIPYSSGASALRAPRSAAALRRAIPRRGALRTRGERGAAGEGDAGRTGPQGDPPTWKCYGNHG